MLVLCPGSAVPGVGACLGVGAGSGGAPFLAGGQLALHVVGALGKCVGVAPGGGAVVTAGHEAGLDEVSPGLARDAAVTTLGAEAAAEEVATGGSLLGGELKGYSALGCDAQAALERLGA